MGVALEGGYNASDFVDFADELWSRVYLSVVSVAGANVSTVPGATTTDATVVGIDLMPEAGYYLGNGLAYFYTAGFGYRMVSGAEGNFGMALGGGIDYALGLDWSSRAMLIYRQGFSEISGAGTLSSFQLALSVGYTF
jgi:hypothetical protein